MTKKILIFITLNLLVLIYLLWPLPAVPDLPQSLRSTEPGDTVQIANVKAFYTDFHRSDVMAYVRQNFQHPLVIRLNYPPEKAKEIYVDTIKSYYLEELVIPFKESLFINGFEWQNDVFTPAVAREANQLLIDGHVYYSKVTFRVFPTSLPTRLIVLVLFNFGLIALLAFYSRVFGRHD